MNTIKKVTTYKEACEIEGVDQLQSLPYPEAKNADQVTINAFAKLILIARVLNEGWQPDWNNDDEAKYYPWFDMETYPDRVGSGVGFSFHVSYYGGSGTNVGSRLCFKSRDLAKFAGETFLSVYREMMAIEK